MAPPTDIAFWPHVADRNTASFRIRCALVVEGLGRLGVPNRFYAPGDAPPRVLVLSKRYDAESVAHAAALRQAHGTCWVLDLCDNHFHLTGGGDLGESGSGRFAVRSAQLVDSVNAADWVVVSSPRLGQEVRSHCPRVRGISVIEDAVDDIARPRPGGPVLSLREQVQLMRQRFFFLRRRAAPGRRLVWFGSHGVGRVDGGMLDLALLSEALNRHHRQAPLSLTVISNKRRKYRQVREAWRFPSLYLPWSNGLFAAAMASHDVALIPVQPNAFTLCKTNNRPVTAFSLGVAVAASSIPSYEEFGAAAILDDWDDGLRSLMDDHPGRVSRIRRARELIDAHYQIDTISAKWVALIAALSSGGTDERGAARVA